MAVKYGKRKSKQYNITYTIITAMLLCTFFLGMVDYLYNTAVDEAYENLHVQTKQIKDDIVLQLTSDRENLQTMANFAAKLYKDGDDYSLLFESFKPIGMIENIGILNSDNSFATKSGVAAYGEAISFNEEKEKGIYISGMIEDITKKDYKLIRSAVPIEVDGKTVGILYGAIKPEKLAGRYKQMVEKLDAQLFVYEKSSGDILIDSVQDSFTNISFLKNRKYNEGTFYEQLVSTDSGFVSFLSAYKNENLHLHYSTIDEFGWMIAMGRYDIQVFAATHDMTRILFIVFLIMLAVISMYILILMRNERKINAVTECASNVRKELLETSDGQNNIQDALIEICKFAKSRSAIFFDTDGEFYHYISPKYEEVMISEKESKYFRSNLFNYAAEFHKFNGNRVNILCIKPNEHMEKTNISFYRFLKQHNIREISLSATINNANHITILATVNSERGKQVRILAEKVSACFSMALYNKKNLNKTILAATTDGLTGVSNRVAYKNDLEEFEKKCLVDFSCVYIDVNELHLCNNKYGHAAGDAMLLYIANTLKEVFYGHRIYRMGGDEFLVFCQDVSQVDVKKNIDILCEKLKYKNYHIAVGMSYRTQNTDTEEMVKEAEVKMYEEKARYYQNKDLKNVLSAANNEYIHIKTGICEIDTMISVLKENYYGICCVSLTNGKAKRILLPAYLNYNEVEENFSNLFSKYVDEMVDPDYHRAVLSFLNYEVITSQLKEGKVPKVKYKRKDGTIALLSVYKICDSVESVYDTLWVFEKE